MKKLNMWRINVLLFTLILCIVPSKFSIGQKEKHIIDYSEPVKIKNEHPRLFFNQYSLPKIKNTALNEERELFDKMKSRVDGLLGVEIKFKDPLIRDGHNSSDHAFGTRAAEAAFVFLILQEEKYLNLCKKLLTVTGDYYKLRNENDLNIHWYNYSRINALAAFDWIYNDLTEQEKKDIGTTLLKELNSMTNHRDRQNVFRRNGGKFTSGFYGPNALPWYLGVVFYKTGIDDELSEELLQRGYEDHISMLEHRSLKAGDDGGAVTGTLGYGMIANLWAEFNFLHTFNSATGCDISNEWSYIPNFLNYVFWNWLPGNREFGYGDARHIDNKLPLKLWHLHMAQMTHFYGETNPNIISLGKWMQTKISKEKQDDFPFARFLLTNTHEKIEAKVPSELIPTARHFENMGQVFLRSGSGPDDTYASFTSGSIANHKHFDNNNFLIFKKGFLTMDTGTRPQPGQHLSHYYCRTVAHNCITVKMPGEIMPKYWGTRALNEERLPIPNDGGQNDSNGAKIIAFDENEFYAYIASDATKAYHEDKVKLVLRQFVFLPPDHFVIFDRVISTNPEYQKRWLLHTAKEPIVETNEFHHEHWGGKLYCKTIFPEQAELKKIGGPGKQFWSDGKNWDLPELTPEDWNYSSMRWLNNNNELFGQWRIEVLPKKSAKDDIFLHLIQVGDSSLKSMVHTKSIKTDDMVGVRFEFNDKEYEVLFSIREKIGGKISLYENGRRTLEEDFKQEVKLQSGL